jgi:uncharacterized surface protein with fasciclin (FAS1) repeats
MSKIIETAIADGSFTTLVTAVKAAGLVETLSGAGPFTVFAPNDEAFAKLPKGTVEGWMQDVAKLKQLLTYHVVAGKVTGAQAAQQPSTRTMEGQNLTLSAKSGVKVNDSKMIKADIVCDNGIIHVLDTVLTLPAAKSANKS